MRLTFERGHFVLDAKLKPDSAWSSGEKKSWTKDPRAALQFQKFSDEKAKRAFDRVFLRRYPAPDLSSLTFLDPHQIAGVRHILTRSRSYLAHAPGAGKTAQAIIAGALTEGPGHVLFIVPPALTANWAREIEQVGRWLKKTLYFSMVGASAQRDEVNWNAKIIICPDSMLLAPWVLGALSKLNFKFVGVDEASRFKEPTSLRTIALFGGVKGGFKSKGLVYGARHAVLMDGSPMPNRPMELWAPTFAMVPEAIDFMNQFEFGMRYCGPRINSFGKWEFKFSSNEDELRARLQKDFMHVVRESELEHPERRRSILFMDVDVRSSAHRSWDKAHLGSIDIDRIDDDLQDRELANWRRELGTRKIKWVSNYVRSRLEEKNESILLFAWHREVAEELANQLCDFTPGLVMGGTKADARENYFDDFQKGKIKLIIGNIAAMGRGHNLQRADRVIFAEFSWCGETNIQAEKRASRRGSEKTHIRCEYVCAPNSIDEVVLNSIFSKDKRVEKVIG